MIYNNRMKSGALYQSHEQAVSSSIIQSLMDTRAVSFRVCTNRSSFIDSRTRVNQSRPSTFKKTNVVVISKEEMDLGQKIPCGADNVQDAILHIAGSMIAGSTSTIPPNTDGPSTAVIPPEVFILPKRSRSCNGRIETSATVTSVYIQKSNGRRTRGANTSWTNDVRERDVNGHSSDSKSHKTPCLLHSGPNDSKNMKEDDYKPSQKTKTVKIHMVHDQSTQTEPIQALLGVSPTIESIDQPCVSTSSSCTLIEPKGIQKEDEEIFWAPHSKRPKQGTKDVEPVIDARDFVGDARGLSHCAPSSFDARKWSSVEFSFADIQLHPPSSHTGIGASKSKDRSDGQVNLRPELKKCSVSSPSSLGRSEDLSQLPMSASPSVSALDKFNEIVPNPMKRFHEEPAWCLANNSEGSRCHNPIAFENQEAVRQLLTQLARMDIEKKTQECIIELNKLIAKAVCWRQRSEIQSKLKNNAPPFAGPTKNEETTKVKREELPGRILTKDGSSTTGRQEAQAVVSSVALSAFNITGWGDKSKLVSSILPNHIHYHTEVIRKSDVSQWVIQQAEKPLTPRERKAGYLYVYWNKASFGIYKIGFTTIDVDKRLKKMGITV